MKPDKQVSEDAEQVNATEAGLGGLAWVLVVRFPPEQPLLRLVAELDAFPEMLFIPGPTTGEPHYSACDEGTQGKTAQSSVFLLLLIYLFKYTYISLLNFIVSFKYLQPLVLPFSCFSLDQLLTTSTIALLPGGYAFRENSFRQPHVSAYDRHLRRKL